MALPLGGKFTMSKLGWVELETLSTEIAHLQSRIDAARASRNYGTVRLLEREMAEVAEHRGRVLADITNEFSEAPTDAQQPTNPPAQGVEGEGKKVDEAREARPDIQAKTLTVVPSANVPLTMDQRGGLDMWDKLTAADLDRVKQGLTTRRSEMLARHAEELKSLEAEQSEIDAIEKAIAVFTQKFRPASIAEVTPLEGERVSV